MKGIYNQQEVHSNLFGMIVADAASGKGSASHARVLLEPIHQAAMTVSSEAAEQSATPTPFIIPANISSAAFIETLEQSGGVGVMFETEIDSVTDALKNEWADYSALLRKTFHHEPVTLARKTNKVYIEVRRPQAAVLLAGTPGQAITLLKSPENGLVSRILFYYFDNPPVWQDVFKSDRPNLTEFFSRHSIELLAIYERYKSRSHTFDLTPQQKEQHKSVFTARMAQIVQLDSDAVSTVKRLGLIAFRIAMVLSIIRAAEGEVIADNIVCSDEDFGTAMTLSGLYMEHALLMIDLLPRTGPLKPNISRFHEALPAQFTRAEAVDVASKLGLKERVVGKYLALMEGKQTKRVNHGHYKKV
ncbi:MAG: DUF3987 domain-containing protein [Flavipsychrobacter sp.]|nr:DUF3987 domain-containing protein [Flavipsychrobacter sp.]